MPDLAANLRAVGTRIAAAAERSGRLPGEVELVVVTKTWPVEMVSRIFEAGHRVFGENKLQDAAGKIPQLPPEACWHFIGHLQRNKARKALELFSTIHSVDSLRLGSHLDRLAGELGLQPRIYLQVNLAGEESKGGFSVPELQEQFVDLLRLDHLQVQGLMSIPPAVDDPERARASFRALRTLRDELQEKNGVPTSGAQHGNEP